MAQQGGAKCHRWRKRKRFAEAQGNIENIILIKNFA